MAEADSSPFFGFSSDCLFYRLEYVLVAFKSQARSSRKTSLLMCTIYNNGIQKMLESTRTETALNYDARKKYEARVLWNPRWIHCRYYKYYNKAVSGNSVLKDYCCAFSSSTAELCCNFHLGCAATTWRASVYLFCYESVFSVFCCVFLLVRVLCCTVQ